MFASRIVLSNDQVDVEVVQVEHIELFGAQHVSSYAFNLAFAELSEQLEDLVTA